ncbi:hypothetical protein SETIT_5G247500v2 [Setaria italica]|uniref:Uncharacterized protein n=1 Tax=Setaria italica TaxID=4555 RepID=A0A368R8Q6_SETIT|nr:hypothetical protein SETIT_5G247500v2 [Setaria italica]
MHTSKVTFQHKVRNHLYPCFLVREKKSPLIQEDVWCWYNIEVWMSTGYTQRLEWYNT